MDRAALGDLRVALATRIRVMCHVRCEWRLSVGRSERGCGASGALAGASGQALVEISAGGLDSGGGVSSAACGDGFSVLLLRTGQVHSLGRVPAWEGTRMGRADVRLCLGRAC